MIDVLVLPRGVHGMPVSDYVDALADRLPDREIRKARTPEQARELVPQARVVTGFTIGEALLQRASNLELFACLYAGTDHLPLDGLQERGITVTNASGVHAPNIAEHVLGQILAFVRGFHEGWQRERRREWRHYQVGELAGSTATVVGQGPIGQTIVDRLNAFDVHTIASRYTPSKPSPADETIGHDEEQLLEVLTDTDHLVLACPLTDATRGLVDRQALLTLPAHAFLVNVARGPVVDTGALVTAIRSNEIAGAALDVTDPEPLPSEHPLWRFENVRITPHNAGHTPAYYERLADIVADNVERLEDDRADEIVNRVP
jgi:phosphoglycerate dehydrogenase-like enzyme